MGFIADNSRELCINPGRSGFRSFAPKSCALGLPARSCLPSHILPKRSIDTCLIAFVGCSMRLEPADHIGVQAKGQLLLEGAIEEAALCARPVEQLASVGGIDGAVGQGGERR